MVGLGLKIDGHVILRLRLKHVILGKYVRKYFTAYLYCKGFVCTLRTRTSVLYTT